MHDVSRHFPKCVRHVEPDERVVVIVEMVSEFVYNADMSIWFPNGVLQVRNGRIVTSHGDVSNEFGKCGGENDGARPSFWLGDGDTSSCSEYVSDESWDRCRHQPMKEIR